jgi:DNA-binding transcriptional LysR family regulator
MSIILLRSFVEVYRQGSVSKAAGQLGLTQPAVSGHIASLEVQIERKLFTRHARGVKPTIIADELAQRVSEALDTAENALAELRARSAVLSGTIHLCGPSDILSDLIADRLFALTMHDLAVQLIPSNDASSIELLLEGRADFAFAISVVDDPRIDHEVFGEEELVLAATPPMAAEIGRADGLAVGLASVPHLTYDVQRSLVRTWLEFNGIETIPGRELVTAPDLRALRNFVTKGLGWSVVPRYLIEAALADGILAEIRGPKGNPMTLYHILWLKSAMRNPRTAKAKRLLFGD